MMGIPNLTIEKRISSSIQIRAWLLDKYGKIELRGFSKNFPKIYNHGVSDCMDFVRDVAKANPRHQAVLEDLARQMADLELVFEDPALQARDR